MPSSSSSSSSSLDHVVIPCHWVSCRATKSLLERLSAMDESALVHVMAIGLANNRKTPKMYKKPYKEVCKLFDRMDKAKLSDESYKKEVLKITPQDCATYITALAGNILLYVEQQHQLPSKAQVMMDTCDDDCTWVRTLHKVYQKDILDVKEESPLPPVPVTPKTPPPPPPPPAITISIIPPTPPTPKFPVTPSRSEIPAPPRSPSPLPLDDDPAPAPPSSNEYPVTPRLSFQLPSPTTAAAADLSSSDHNPPSTTEIKSPTREDWMRYTEQVDLYDEDTCMEPSDSQEVADDLGRKRPRSESDAAAAEDALSMAKRHDSESKQWESSQPSSSSSQSEGGPTVFHVASYDSPVVGRRVLSLLKTPTSINTSSSSTSSSSSSHRPLFRRSSPSCLMTNESPGRRAIFQQPSHASPAPLNLDDTSDVAAPSSSSSATAPAPATTTTNHDQAGDDEEQTQTNGTQPLVYPSHHHHDQSVLQCYRVDEEKESSASQSESIPHLLHEKVTTLFSLKDVFYLQLIWSLLHTKDEHGRYYPWYDCLFSSAIEWLASLNERDIDTGGLASQIILFLNGFTLSADFPCAACL